jgi:formylglycine-generating enzyme required for sulfatase activity
MTALSYGLEILGNTESNRVNLELLLEFRERLVPFVGAGLSVDFGYPTWTDLLLRIAGEVGLRDQMKAQLANNQFEEAAETITKRYSRQFNATLRQIFDREKLPKPLGRGAVRHLPRIARGPVLTTNFDAVLEQTFEDADRRFETILAGADVGAASYAIQRNASVLLKLHGDYFNPKNRVLTLSEYKEAYGSENPQAVNMNLALPRIISQTFGAGAMLFLGCSLMRDRTTQVLAQIAKVLEGPTQFALLQAPDKATIEARRSELDSWGVLPLFFPPGQFKRVETFLAFLADAIQGRPGLAGPLPTVANTDQVDLGVLLENWRAHAAVVSVLTQFLPIQAEVLSDKVITESNYFSSKGAEQTSDRLFRPVEFRLFEAEESDEKTPIVPLHTLAHSPGLTFILSDFADDVRETMRWIRHSLSDGKNGDNTLIAWIQGQSLTQPAKGESAKFVRTELLEASLEHAMSTVEALGHRVENMGKDQIFGRLVTLVDFSWFDLRKTRGEGDRIEPMFRRMIELHSTLRSNHQTLVVGLPRHFLLLPDMLQFLSAANTWVSAALFSQSAENRSDQLRELLKLIHLDSEFVAEVCEFLTCDFQSSKVAVEVGSIPVGSFLCCNSNALIYAMASELAKIKGADRWQEKLAHGLARRAFWDPAIRLSQFSSTPSGEGVKYVSIPVDVLPADREGIYGYLNCAEEIPLAVPECLLCGEAGGGKTTALKSVERLFSLPRTGGDRTPAAWLPLEFSEAMTPLRPLISEIISQTGAAGPESMFKVVSSPLFILIDNVENAPRELVDLRKAARSVGSRLGMLMTHRSFPGVSTGLENIPGMRIAQLRPLTPRMASQIADKAVDDLLRGWGMIDLPQGRLCQSPFMLSYCATALLRAEGPEDDRSVTDILAETLEERTRLANTHRRDEILTELLPLLAARGLRSGKSAVDHAEFTRSLAQEHLSDAYDIGWLRDAAALGLLILVDPERQVYVFRHVIYQEYFAARYLAQNDTARLQALREASRPPRGRRWYNGLRLMMPLLSEPIWEEVLETVAGYNNGELFGVLLSGLRPSQLRKLLLAVAPAVVSKEKSPENNTEATLVGMCNPPTRVGLTALGLADPRIFPLTLFKSEARSAFGEALARRIDEERWGKPFELNGVRYQIGRYPVTNLEFHRFVKDGGYQKIGAKYHDSQYLPIKDGIQQIRTMQPAGPRYWAQPSEGRSALREPNCPVVGVSLHEARAYCRWLSDRCGDGFAYRVPRVAEWTYVAYSRWPSARYSMMSALPDSLPITPLPLSIDPLCEESFRVMLEQIRPELANAGPTPVGIFLDRESLCADLFGNVWEWCDTSSDEYQACVRGGPRPTCSLQSLLFEGVFAPTEGSELVGFRILRELDRSDASLR